MDNTLVAAFIGAGSAIAGVILGGVLTGAGSWWERSRKRKNVRRVLSLEHTYNIDLFEAFWKQVNQENQAQGQFDAIKEFERNMRLAEEHLDEWGHLMWQSYADEVASALSEKEFQQSYRLHNTLDTFSAQRNAFAEKILGDAGRTAMAAYGRQKHLQSSPSGAHTPTYTPINIATINDTNELVRPLWEECARLYAICHHISNPIHA